MAWSVGIVAVVFALAALAFWWRATARRAVLDSGSARAAWRAADPEADIARVVLADDGHAALLKLIDGRRAVVWTVGSRVLVRELDPAQSEILAQKGGLSIRFSDWRRSRLRLPFADPKGRKDWLDPTRSRTA